MSRRIRRNLSFANLTAMVALFVALGGASYAAVALPQGSVGAPQLRSNAVTGTKIKNGAVGSFDLAKSVRLKLALAGEPTPPAGPAGGDLTGSYPNPAIGANTIGAAQLKPDAVPADGAGVDGSTKLATASVGASELKPDAVRAASIGTISVVTNVTNVANAANGTVTAQCPAGSVVLSGGGQPGLFGVELTTTRPSGSTGWTAQARNNSGSATTLTAFAVCLLP